MIHHNKKSRKYQAPVRPARAREHFHYKALFAKKLAGAASND